MSIKHGKGKLLFPSHDEITNRTQLHRGCNDEGWCQIMKGDDARKNNQKEDTYDLLQSFLVNSGLIAINSKEEQ